MPGMPAEEIKMVKQPHAGLDNSKAGAACVATATMVAARIKKADHAEDMACPNTQQTIAVLRTPSMD